MQRISVTTLEKFRRFMAGASSFDTEESLLQSLRGEFKGNDKTKVGGAFHKILEGDYAEINGNYLVVDKDHFIFTHDQAKYALRYRDVHRLMVHEMDVRTVFETAYFPIQVTGRVDGIEGMHVHDGKTRFREFSADDYLESSQWKFYLHSLGLDTFFYDVFEIQDFKGLGNKAPYYIKANIKPHPPIRCNRYENMVGDITNLLNDFLEYLHYRGYVTLLKPAIIEEQPF